jgi:hypothetical protein
MKSDKPDGSLQKASSSLEGEGTCSPGVPRAGHMGVGSWLRLGLGSGIAATCAAWDDAPGGVPTLLPGPAALLTSVAGSTCDACRLAAITDPNSSAAVSRCALSAARDMGQPEEIGGDRTWCASTWRPGATVVAVLLLLLSRHCPIFSACDA